MAKRPIRLSTAVNRAIGGMHWLTDADDAAVAQLRQYARLIDEAADVSPEEARRAAARLGSLMTGLLRQMGGTPMGRRELAVEQAEVKGRLAELRAIRGGHGA